MPQDEAAAISGHDDPEAAARWALERPGTATQWCLIKLGAAGALLVTRDEDSPLRHNSLKVRAAGIQCRAGAAAQPKLLAGFWWQTNLLSSSSKSMARHDQHTLSQACTGAQCCLRTNLLRGSHADNPSLQVPVKDTVGCGDSCAAAIVLGYTRGHDTAPVGLLRLNAPGLRRSQT